jgi:Pectate lyase superfamily protein
MIKASLLILLATLSSVFSKTITASGGTPSAVQTAIDSAADGDTVVIPAGNFSWSSGIQIKKPIKVFGAGNSTVISAGSATGVTMTPSTKGHVEFGKVKFVRVPVSGDAQHFVRATDAPGQPMLLHDCEFNTAQFGNRSVEWGTNGGVIYNCTFISTDKADNAGCAFKNPSSDSAWHEPDFMGMADTDGTHNTYLEDCTFKFHFLQALDFDDNSRTVMRHCVFDNAAIASHGQETSAVGARQWEVYDCEFIFTPGVSNPTPSQFPLNMNYFLFIRGGGPGACFNNKIPDISSQAWGNKAEVKFTLYNITRKGQVPCQTQYPASHQIGWGINAKGEFVLDPVYFWGNTGGGNYDNPSLEDADDQCGNGMHTKDFVQKGREFYVNTKKPGYEPYPYPHPLREGASPTPTPPEPTPAPTSTPRPTVTPGPTATPAQTFEDWIKKQNDWIRANPPEPD